MNPLEPQILVAGVGNTWMKDDAFGSEVVKGLLQTDLPEGVTVLDFGTGGLDLAYELMRGYNAMILVDVSRQGGDPGTLYVMDPDPAEIKVIGDGEVVNPHGMDPQTVLRFVKTDRRLARAGRDRRLRARSGRGARPGHVARGGGRCRARGEAGRRDAGRASRRGRRGGGGRGGESTGEGY